MSDTPNSHRSQREASIVDRHLDSSFTANPGAISGAQDASATEESSLLLQGGDVHRDIYKIKARANLPRRANTFSAHTASAHHAEPTPSEQLEPNGFRREFVQKHKLTRTLTSTVTAPMASFVTFLDLYGSFAGENLADDDEDSTALSDQEDGPQDERRPLLGSRKGSKRGIQQGTASQTRTFFTLLKAFVGTGIMFLPRAFRNGGILFSSITLVTISLVTSLCFHLLLQCRAKVGGGGYGELGGAIVGRWFRSIILASVTISQLGFVCAGIIFTAENLDAFFRAVSDNIKIGSIGLILGQFIVLIPLALIRNISKLGPVALIADVFIMIGLIYIWSFDIGQLSKHGIDKSVQLFNPDAFTLTIGSAIFTFEGIGLILPIQSSMAKPEKFERLLYVVMVIITIIFTSVGVLCYATFGERTEIQILSNFPQHNKVVNTVQFLYSLAVLAGEPVQLFPAVRIIETSLFGERATGKRSALIKWKKNALRTAAMCLCGVVAILGANDLDKFVALIGSFACVPLVYIYPPFLHLRGVAVSRVAKTMDIVLIVVGFVAMVYTTAVTLQQWVKS